MLIYMKSIGNIWALHGGGPRSSILCVLVLPFGLATACYLFTKLLQPLVKSWRFQGLQTVIYLDDGIAAVEGKLEAAKASNNTAGPS